MKIGITGSTGILGSILLEELRSRGKDYSCFTGDITKINDIYEWIESENFEYIIHLAAIVPTYKVKENLLKAFNVNAIGTKNLAEVLSVTSKDTWLFYASTSHVYKSKENPISENDLIDPVSEYGLTKYAGEVMAKKMYSNLCIGRMFSIYHHTQETPFLYPSIEKRLEEEDLTKDFELYGAESYRDFLNAEKVVDIIIGLMNKKALGLYNIASGNGVKVKDFVSKMTPKDIKIKHIGDKDYLVADISKLEKKLHE